VFLFFHFSAIISATKDKQDREAAILLQNVIQWYCVDQADEDELKPYGQVLNFHIEQAFKNKQDDFSYP